MIRRAGVGQRRSSSDCRGSAFGNPIGDETWRQIGSDYWAVNTEVEY